ncbi:TIGR03826 family flagellar region protein [Bacillus sp. CHD6a]|uniref:TIGR03826 family flagellar region protein n=1 Tax=Bacillus sp. CHD6a TaxID=1643452 RepID=UPI0006CD1494|nr:TIGR03826 family flagellar region protein [Bacillus sp. CHD6a]KPB05653.1 membrane protein [Bacillus sp. CHD6a]
MSQLDNCPSCGQIYVKNAFREVCETCYKEEEAKYQTVYKYIRQRENRTASMEQVVEGTGVEEYLIIKFIRKGRIQLVHFPNLGYPCDRCGRIIREDKLCQGCKKDIHGQLSQLEREEERKRAIREEGKTYHVINKKF